jgi:hypothetical protein
VIGLGDSFRGISLAKLSTPRNMLTLHRAALKPFPSSHSVRLTYRSKSGMQGQKGKVLPGIEPGSPGCPTPPK